MRLNYDCVRDVLLKLEELLLIKYDNKSDSFSFNRINIKQIYESFPDKKYSMEDILYTVKNLSEAGFISAPALYGCGNLTTCFVTDITYNGNEFINKVRPDTVWEKIKKALRKVGSVSLPIISEIASSLASAGLAAMLNLS